MSETTNTPPTLPKLHRVFGWDPTEVSFVRKAGNRRKMLTHRKEAETMPYTPSVEAELIERLKALDPAMERHIALNVGKRKIERDAEGTQMEPLDAQTVAALKASARTLAGFADQLTMSDIMAMAQQIGVNGDEAAAAEQAEGDDEGAENAASGEVEPTETAPAGKTTTPQPTAKEGLPADVAKKAGSAATNAGAAPHTMDTDMPQKPQGVSDADHKAAMDAANAAYADALKAKGHKTERSAEPPAAAVSEQAAAEPEVTPTAAAPSALSTLTAEQRAEVEAMVAEATKHLTQRSANQEAELKAEREARLTREFAAKAEKYKLMGVPTDKVAALLRSASDKPEALEAMESAFATACERAKVSESRGGNMFGERGSSQSAPAGSAEEKLNGLANSLIERSAEGGTPKSFHQAYREACYSPQGRQLWAEMNQQRQGA